ncbi:MAG: PRC-barrel domain-containing protein, partial [Rhodomicrobium sp.]
MKRAVLTSAAVLLSVSSGAFAQTNPSAVPSQAANPPAKTAQSETQVNAPAESVRQQLTANLQQAGFTNIKVVADSFFVQATDKSGNPVTIFLRPDSMTIVSEADVNGRSAQDGVRGTFASIPSRDELSSKVVGLEVYNSANQDVGTIKDVAFNANGVKAYIVGVGGFIGMGEHHVAVRPSALAISYNPAEKKWHATMNVNADQLKAAPDWMTVNAQPTAGGMFTSILPTDDLNSQVVGLEVYNSANQDIGTIKDVAFNAGGLTAYIVGVGGYLGLGERYAALRPSAVALSYNASEKKWH